jgi:hypothetical protein
MSETVSFSRIAQSTNRGRRPRRNEIQQCARDHTALTDRAGAWSRIAGEQHPGELLVGDRDHLAALTDGTAVLDRTERRWSTLGLYRTREQRIAAWWRSQASALVKASGRMSDCPRLCRMKVSA